MVSHSLSDFVLFAFWKQILSMRASRLTEQEKAQITHSVTIFLLDMSFYSRLKQLDACKQCKKKKVTVESKI